MNKITFSAIWTALFFTIFVVLLSESAIICADPYSYGENDTYLGQIVDSYINDDNVNATINVINNVTLGCMELEYYIDSYLLQDLTIFNEIDILADHITVNSSRVEWNQQTRDEDTRIYRDYGASHFDDFILNFTMEYTDIEAGDATSNAVNFPIIFSNSGGNFDNIWASSSLMLYVNQVGAIDDQYDIYLVSRSGGGTDDLLNTGALAIGKYYITFRRIGAKLYSEFYTNENRTTQAFNMSINCNNDDLRYIVLACSRDTIIDPNDHSTGYIKNVMLYPVTGYSNGYYYTIDMLSGDIGLNLMYNATIPANTGITIEFSKDNDTWVNHNNVTGYDTLVNGFESIDLRDIDISNMYMRLYMTTTDSIVTPRMYQLRLVTIIGKVDTASSFILVLFLLSIALLLIRGVK